MTKSEKFILKRRVVTMSLFRLTFLKAHWLIITLAVVAADDAYVQETNGKEEGLNFKTAGFTASFAKQLNQMQSMADLASFLGSEDRRFCSKATFTFMRDSKTAESDVTRWQHSVSKLQQHCSGNLRGRSIPVQGLKKRELTNIQRAKLEAKKVSCKPRVVHVELPPAPLGTSYYPECVTAKRCGGCCHSALLECRPTNTTTVKKWVTKFQVEPKNKYDKTHFVPIVQHKSCECGCKILPSHCTKMQVYDEESCECKCVNESEMNACEHPKEWDPNLCSCTCPQSLFCSTGAHIHPDSCKCVSGKNSKQSRGKKKQ